MTGDPAAVCAGTFVVGGAVGAGIGAAIRHDTWKLVPLDRLRVSVVPIPRGFGFGFGFGASIAF